MRGLWLQTQHAGAMVTQEVLQPLVALAVAVVVRLTVLIPVVLAAQGEYRGLALAGVAAALIILTTVLTELAWTVRLAALLAAAAAAGTEGMALMPVAPVVLAAPVIVALQFLRT